MTTPIVFQITDAGLTAALDAQANGLTLHFTHVGIGTGKYTPTGSETALRNETGRWTIGGGGVNPESKTIQFSCAMQSSATLDAFEVGVFSSNGTLVAVASTTSTQPMIHITPNVTFVAALGLSLGTIPTSAITVTIDSDGAIAQVMMGQHLAAINPHPQYANKQNNDLDHQDFDARINALATALEQAIIDQRDRFFPVGKGIYIVYDNSDPATHLGFGVWQLIGKGQALVGLSDVSGHPAWTKTVGSTFGEYEHTLTVDEIPGHQHGQRADSDGGANQPQVTNSSGGVDGLRGQTDPASTGKTQVMTDSAGGGLAHNNVQPSFVVAIWLRVA